MMIFRRFFFLLLIFPFAVSPLAAQEDPLSTPGTGTEVKSRAFPLTFYLDFGTHKLQAFQRVRYEGEYLNYDLETFESEWQWRETDYKDYFSDERMRSYSLTTILTVWKGLGFGLEYHIMLISPRNQANLDESVPNFSIAAVADYDYKPAFLKGFFVRPSVAFGSYQSNNFYEGEGREIYASFRLGTGYRLNNKFALQLFAGQNLYYYYEESFSNRFDRDELTRIHMNVLEVGFGLSYRFTLEHAPHK